MNRPMKKPTCFVALRSTRSSWYVAIGCSTSTLPIVSTRNHAPRIWDFLIGLKTDLIKGGSIETNNFGN